MTALSALGGVAIAGPVLAICPGLPILLGPRPIGPCWEDPHAA